MNVKKNIIDLSNKIKNNKKIQWIIIISIMIVLIICIFLSNNQTKKTISTENVVDNYVYSLETKLKETLSKIEGTGEISVAITVESGMETVLATKTTTTTTSSGTEVIETPILVNGKTVVLKENYPKIVGVLIVAKGANSISTMNKIQQATVSLLNINLNQIEILNMK